MWPRIPSLSKIARRGGVPPFSPPLVQASECFLVAPMEVHILISSEHHKIYSGNLPPQTCSLTAAQVLGELRAARPRDYAAKPVSG